jgi:hypothetical protein
MYSSIPDQRIPLAEKDKAWKKKTMDAYLNLSEYTRSIRKRELQRLYDYYNGVMYPEDYDYVLKPYGKSRKAFPSKMRNYPIIKPTIDLLLGEKSRRPFNYSVIAINADAVDRKEKAKMDFINEQAMQMFTNELNAMGIDTGEESKPVPPPDNLQQQFERTYVDHVAVLGQKGLTYILQHQEIHEKMQKGWFHFLVAGETFSERTIRNNEVIYEVLNPLDVDYDLDPDLDYVEDGDWAKVTKYMGPTSILKNWGQFLDKDQYNKIISDSNFDSGNLFISSRENTNNSRLIRVQILYWQSMKRTGFFTSVNPETGMPETVVVEDGFKIPQEAKLYGETSLEWIYDNSPWQGIRIGEDLDIDVRPVTEERVSLDNLSNTKLPINGKRYSDINSENISLVKLGVPFQVNYNIYKYRLETAIAKSKDIIAQLDINLIPKKWDMDKFMYFVEGTGIAWVDYDKEGVRLSPQHQTVMDLSIKTIGMYMDLLNSIQAEWENVSGVNNQRRGDVGQYQGKAMGQQAIIQSSHTTEDTYRKFAGFERRDLQACIDLAKHAWINGKKGMYIMPDGSQQFLDAPEGIPINADLGVFVTDATSEVEKFNFAKELAQSMVQKGGRVSTALDMIEGDSFIILKEKVKKAEKMQDELQQAQAQAEQEQLQAQQEQQLQMHQEQLADKEADRELERSEGEADRQNKITLMEMQLNAKPQVIVPDENRKLSLEERKVDETRRATESAERQKDKELQLKSSEIQLKAATEKYKVDNKPKPTSK